MVNINKHLASQLMKVVDRREQHTRMATKSEFFVLAFVLLQIGEPIYSARILGYLLSPSQSHFVIHDALMRGLAAKGHNVCIYQNSSHCRNLILHHSHRSQYSVYSRVPRIQSRTTASSNWNQTLRTLMPLRKRKRKC